MLQNPLDGTICPFDLEQPEPTGLSTTVLDEADHLGFRGASASYVAGALAADVAFVHFYVAAELRQALSEGDFMYKNNMLPRRFKLEDAIELVEVGTV